MSKETSFLYDWKLKLGILAAIVMPTVTATAAFYKLEARLNEKSFQTENRINKVELDVERNFADKRTVDDMHKDINKMQNDITEIKTLLKRRFK